MSDSRLDCMQAQPGCCASLTVYQVRPSPARLRTSRASASAGAQGCGPGSSSERTRTAVTAALKKKLKDIMGDFQVLRQRLNEEYRCAAGV